MTEISSKMGNNSKKFVIKICIPIIYRVYMKYYLVKRHLLVSIISISL